MAYGFCEDYFAGFLTMTIQPAEMPLQSEFLAQVTSRKSSAKCDNSMNIVVYDT